MSYEKICNLLLLSSKLTNKLKTDKSLKSLLKQQCDRKQGQKTRFFCEILK